MRWWKYLELLSMLIEVGRVNYTQVPKLLCRLAEKGDGKMSLPANFGIGSQQQVACRNQTLKPNQKERKQHQKKHKAII